MRSDTDVMQDEYKLRDATKELAEMEEVMIGLWRMLVRSCLSSYRYTRACPHAPPVRLGAEIWPRKGNFSLFIFCIYNSMTSRQP